MEAELWRLGAADLCELFRTGTSSPSAVLESVLDRAAQVEPKLNAFAVLDADGARQAAAESDVRWRARQPCGLLDGVPISVKDNIPVAGLPCAWGSRFFLDNVPSRDELAVVRLRGAGAVILGKTNVSEFTVGPGGTVYTEAFGATRNPWDTRLTTGSSSGGAVAAVASGVGVVALCTDGGGSIRRPASFSNLVGLKPSAGLVARWDGLPQILPGCEVVGPIARTVEDLYTVLKVIAGPDSHDRESLAMAGKPLAAAIAKLGRQRILYVPRFGDSPVDEPIAHACAHLADALRELGHEVQEGEVPFDVSLFDRNWPAFAAVGLSMVLHGMDWQGRISPSRAEMAGIGASYDAVSYALIFEDFRQLQAQVGVLFDKFDLLLTPAAGAMPWAVREDAPVHHRVFTGFANVAGVPAIAIPCEPSQEGVPIGCQLVGPIGSDEILVAMAAELQTAIRWNDRWPTI